jgi:hypothetical protein
MCVCLVEGVHALIIDQAPSPRPCTHGDLQYSSTCSPEMYCGDEVSAIVGDIGSNTSKFGYAGEDMPKAVIPSVGCGFLGGELVLVLTLPVTLPSSSEWARRKGLR